MGLEQSAIPLFAGHQTFHPRFGWIKKGYDAAAKDPQIFTRPDAPIQLGVGKNMVEAIRFWCVAMRVVEKLPNPQRPRMSIAVPSGVGQVLLGDGGFDPYVEDPTTLWILHWLAVSEGSYLPVWRSAFSDFTAVEFDDEELRRFAIEEVRATSWHQPKESTVGKDVDCLLRMYGTREARGRQTLDDLLDSPFRELGLIVPSPSRKGAFRFVRRTRATIPPAAVAYASLDYMAMVDPNARTMSISRLANDPGSPGRVMKLAEDVVRQSLERTARSVQGLTVAAPAGSPQLMLDIDPVSAALAALLAHHAERGRPVEQLPVGVVAGPLARQAPQSQLRLHDGVAS